MARPQQRMLLRPQPALGVLLLLALLAGRAADAFTLSCFRGKDSSAGTGAAAYCAHQRPLPGTDAFAQRTARLVVPPSSSLHAAKKPTSEDAKRSAGRFNPMYALARFALALAPSALMGVGLVPLLAEPRAVMAAQADDQFKIKRGAASTLNSGTVKTMTRGVNIQNANFEGKDLTGVSFQQSLVRDGNFRGATLVSSSFFDADLSGADFTGANMKLVNLELANMKNANLKNAIVTEAYVSGATRLTDIQIEGSDWSDTLLRKDQQMYLCKRASGVNPVTKVATKDSLGCPE